MGVRVKGTHPRGCLGSSGCFGLAVHAAVSLLRTLHDHCHAHAAADAHSGEAVASITPLHFVEQGHSNSSAACAHRMANGNGPAVDVDTIPVPLQLFAHGQGLSGEGFIEFNEVDILEFEAGTLQRLAGGWNGADAHHPGRDAGGAKARG